MGKMEWRATHDRSRSLAHFRISSVSFASELAGFPFQTGHHGELPGPAPVRPPSTAWMSDELLAETRRVWSKAYGRVISEEEAMEILTNVRRLADVLMRAKAEEQQT